MSKIYKVTNMDMYASCGEQAPSTLIQYSTSMISKSQTYLKMKCRYFNGY